MATAGVLRDALERLVQLGLEADLAVLYLHLLVHGPGRPSALALALKTSRAGVYRRLERSVEQGLVEAVQERPVVYRASEPAMVFKVLHDQNVRKAEESQRMREEAGRFAARFGTVAEAGAAGITFRYLSGRLAGYEEIHRMLDVAGEEVLVVNTHPAAAALAERAGLWGRLSAHTSAGVRVRVLMTGGQALHLHGRENPGTAKVLPPGDILRFLVVDRRHVLLCVENDGSSWMDSPLEKVVVTDAPGFVTSYMALFRHLWEGAVAVEGQPQLSDTLYSLDR